MVPYHRATLACLAIVVLILSLGQSAKAAYATPTPKGDGRTNDTLAIQDALTVAAATCATVSLSCTASNIYLVSSTIQVPACVKLEGACGGIPDEGSANTVGTTLRWTGSGAGPVLYFHDAAGASLSRLSVDCGPQVNSTIGIQYDSDDNPSASFVNLDTLMVKGCHQAVVIGVPNATPVVSVSECASNPLQLGCYQEDQLKLERYRILGNLGDAGGEGIHINSANAAQGSLISDGNIQGVNIGIHIILTNGGLVIQSSNMGTSPGVNPTFLQVESNVAASPTLINDEVEGTGTAAVTDHSCNPLGTPGKPVWLYNVWNDSPIVVDGSENVTSIGNLVTNATVTNNASCPPLNGQPQLPHILSLNEGGWTVGGTATSANLTTIAFGGAQFGGSLVDNDVIAAKGSSDPSQCDFPSTILPGDLMACEGTHSGELYLGQDLMLLNNGDGTLDTEGLMKIQTGLYQDGSGLKHQTVSTGNIAAGSAIQIPLTWTTEFADANYQAICNVQDNTGFLQLINTSVPVATEVSIAVKNNDTSNSHSGSVACIAIHN